MHRIKGNIAWILPPRCATKFTLYGVLEKYKAREHKDSQHGIVIEHLEDRMLYMNIRDPYTRFLSWWRMKNARGITYGIEEYVDNILNETVLSNKSAFSNFNNKEKRTYHSVQYWKNDMSYVKPLSHFLDDWSIPLERVDRFIRFEHLNDDLKAAGFDPTPHFKFTPNSPEVKKLHVNNKTYIHTLERYPVDDPAYHPDITPDLIKVVNTLYKKDFEYFDYAQIKG